MEENKFYVGQKVKVYDHTGNEWIRTVEKITPTGRVKVGSTYYVNGSEYTSYSWGKTYIEPATEEIIAQHNKRQFTSRVMSELHHIEKMTYEDAVKVNSILNLVKEK